MKGVNSECVRHNIRYFTEGGNGWVLREPYDRLLRSIAVLVAFSSLTVPLSSYKRSRVGVVVGVVGGVGKRRTMFRRVWPLHKCLAP